MRGTQKRVVYLKNTGSDMFDEAYFIIKEKTEQLFTQSGDDLIKEANRIISEQTVRRGIRGGGRKLRDVCAFLTGALLSFILTVLIFGNI